LLSNIDPIVGGALFSSATIGCKLCHIVTELDLLDSITLYMRHLRTAAMHTRLTRSIEAERSNIKVCKSSDYTRTARQTTDC
jgi:hypothetical protein